MYLRGVKKPLENLVVLGLLLPLIWIYAPSTHDWGGDFAAYIAQAKNILTGTPIGDTGYLYNPDYFKLAPPSYPPGFSILLAGWIAVFGDHISGLVTFMSILLLFFGWGLFKLFRIRFAFGVSIAALLITMYNPWMIRFKVEVIADMPFAMLVIWSVLAYRRAILAKEKILKKWLWCVLLVSMAILTKTIGWVVLIAFVLDSLVRLFRSKCVDPIMGMVVMLAGTLAITYSVNHFWLPAPAEHLSHFSAIVGQTDALWKTALWNIEEYANIYQSFFIKDVGPFTIIATTTGSLLFIFGMIGAVVRWVRHGIQVEDWVFLGLMGGLILFPITNGFRYLLPAFPFLFGYSIYGLGILPWNWFVRGLLPTLSVLIMFGQYAKGWTKIADLPEEIEGPYHSKYAQLHEAIDRIHAEFPDALFAAAKPRVFAYMHHIEAFSIPLDLGVKQTERELFKIAGGRPVFVIQVKATEHSSLDVLEGPSYSSDTSPSDFTIVGPWKEPVQPTQTDCDQLHLYPYEKALCLFDVDSRWQDSTAFLRYMHLSPWGNALFEINPVDTTYQLTIQTVERDSNFTPGIEYQTQLTSTQWRSIQSLLEAFHITQRPIQTIEFDRLDGGTTFIEAGTSRGYGLMIRPEKGNRLATPEDLLSAQLDTLLIQQILHIPSGREWDETLEKSPALGLLGD